MSRTEDRSIADRVAEVARVVERLDVLHVATTIELVRGVEPWAASMRTVADVRACMRFAPQVEVVERRRDIDLLIDPRSGERRLRTGTNATEFDSLASACKRVEIVITCHEWQIDAILSAAKTTAILGGNRAGKTRAVIYWLVRQILLRGRAPTPDRAGAVFWWVGPTALSAFQAGWVRGLKVVLPPELVIGEGPPSHRAQQVVRLIDGSVIALQHAQGDGANLKALEVEAIAGDELCEWAHPGNWQQVNSRTSQTGGPICVASTPKLGHWAREKLLLQEAHSGGAIESHSFDIVQNPWITSARVWQHLLADGSLTETELEEQVLPAPDRAAAARATVTSPTSLRENFGVWAGDGLTLWAEWTEACARELTRAGNGARWAALTTAARLVGGVQQVPEQLPDITAIAAATIFGADRPIARVAGQDFNRNPQTTLICQVFGVAGIPSTWVLLVLEEVQTVGTIEAHAERLRTIDPDVAIVCDPSGDMPTSKQDSLDSDDASRLRERGFRVVSACGRGRKLRSQKPTITLINKLIHERRLYVHLRCTQTIRALESQQARPDGRIAKESGKASDRLSSPTDALRYLVWRLFRHELARHVEWEI